MRNARCMRGSMVLHPGVCVNRAAVVDTRDGSLRTGGNQRIMAEGLYPWMGSDQKTGWRKSKALRCSLWCPDPIECIYIYISNSCNLRQLYHISRIVIDVKMSACGWGFFWQPSSPEDPLRRSLCRFERWPGAVFFCRERWWFSNSCKKWSEAIAAIHSYTVSWCVSFWQNFRSLITAWRLLPSFAGLLPKYYCLWFPGCTSKYTHMGLSMLRFRLSYNLVGYIEVSHNIM